MNKVYIGMVDKQDELDYPFQLIFGYLFEDQFMYWLDRGFNFDNSERLQLDEVSR